MKIWLRPLPFVLIAAYGLSRAGRAPVDDAAPSRSAALCSTLAAMQGLTCEPSDVVWIQGPSGVSGAMRGKGRALVRGKEKPERSSSADPNAPADADTLDLFSVDARLSPEGQLLDVGDAHNLTRSTGADEGFPVAHGSLVAYLIEVDGRPEALHVLDLAGHDLHSYDELTRLERFQVKVADLQATGASRGVKKTVFTLVPAPKKATLAFRPDGMLEVKGMYGANGNDARVIPIDPQRGVVADAAAAGQVRVTPEGMIAKPPTLAPWMSDRLRAVSWFGDEKNQVLKAVVFTTLEWVKGKRAAITGDTGEQAAQDDLGSLNNNNTGKPASFTDPEIGWPPKPLEPTIKPALAGEGQWIRLDDDPFITPLPSLPSPFVTTFVRTDPSAQHTRVYITLWDPRLVALHMEAGTVEPVSATGEAGPGQIPRTPEIVRRVIAGFNGGFQATHGEFGMQANGVLYLPPKPYAATVMEMRDGTTAFGAWPTKTEVPDEVLSFRQNMNFMVQNDKYNPWGRAWWGGVPPGWHDAIHTTRSGVCLTKDGFVAYLFGHDIGPEPLGRAMLAARCQVGIHLDMNPGLAGFEFYNVQTASTWKPLGRPLQPDWEYEGSFKDMPEFKFRSRRMTKSMGHILFPRYVQRDARDFFYLTTRPVLPGPQVDVGGSEWRVKGLPQHGYPYASAIASVRLSIPGERRVRIMRIDPRTVRVGAQGVEQDEKTTVAVFGRPPRMKPLVSPTTTPTPTRPDAGAAAAVPVDPNEKKLWIGSHIFTIDKNPTAPNAVAIASVLPPGSASAAIARGAVGISDEDGMLQWIELLPEDVGGIETSEAMLKVLEKIGCSSRALLAGDVRAFLGGALDIGGEPAAPTAIAIRLTRAQSPGAKHIFESTPIVQQAVWGPLQAQRVKWRPTLAPPDKPAASASGSGSPTPKPPR